MSPVARIIFWIVLILLALIGIGYLTPHETANVVSSRPGPTPTPNYNQSDAEALAQAKASAGMIPEMDFSTHPKETMERMRRCARESGGDFKKLSIRDQRMFNSVTGGYGKDWLKELSQHPERHK